MTHAHHSATPVSTHDTTRIDDTRIKAVRPLITPALLQEWLPAPDAAQTLVETSRAALSRVLHGQDDRLIVVVGPCSIHDHGQAMEYAHALKAQADALGNDLIVVMRVYFEKPRTTVGWKGYINDPRLDGSFAINEGLELARKLLLDVLATGLPVGTEFLDLLSPQFISDLVVFGKGRTPTHAGIYVGADRFVHAPSAGGEVRMDHLQSRYWSRQNASFRRL